jgi:orotidine-5'-phosphate decarboxylase
MTANGAHGVRRIVSLGLPVFADTKFHDIPNTVAGAAREVASLGIAMFNIHASGGMEMMRAGLEAARRANPEVKVLGVTVLTSLAADDLDTIGQNGPLGTQVLKLAQLAQEVGLDGVVCGANEVRAVRSKTGTGFLIVVPGIRPQGSEPGDQRRAVTPVDALRAGADVLVVGRPITAAADPPAAARAIAAALSEVQA